MPILTRMGIFFLTTSVDTAPVDLIRGVMVADRPQRTTLLSQLGAVTYELEPEPAPVCLEFNADGTCASVVIGSNPWPRMDALPGFGTDTVLGDAFVNQLAAVGVDTRGVSPFSSFRIPMLPIRSEGLDINPTGTIDFSQVDGIYLALQVDYVVQGQPIPSQLVSSCAPDATLDEAGREDSAADCSDQVDNDHDGLTDCADAATCARFCPAP